MENFIDEVICNFIQYNFSNCYSMKLCSFYSWNYIVSLGNVYFYICSVVEVLSGIMRNFAVIDQSLT